MAQVISITPFSPPTVQTGTGWMWITGGPNHQHSTKYTPERDECDKSE
jgi:hypothetical protein